MLSDLLDTYPAKEHGSLYLRFSRAFNRGEFRALELSSNLTLVSIRGKPYTRLDYAIPTSDVKDVQLFLSSISRPSYELTATEAALLPDESLEELIKAQVHAKKHSRRRSSARNGASSKKTSCDYSPLRVPQKRYQSFCET